VDAPDALGQQGGDGEYGEAVPPLLLGHGNRVGNGGLARACFCLAAADSPADHQNIGKVLGKMFPEGLEFSWDNDSWAGLRGGTDKPWGAVVALYEKIEKTKGILPEPGQVTVGGLE